MVLGGFYSLNAQYRENRPSSVTPSLNSCAADVLKAALAERLSQAIAIETDPLSLKPFHLFYRSLFWSSAERYSYWLNHLNAHGLDEGGIQALIEFSVNGCPVPFDPFTEASSAAYVHPTAICLDDTRVMETLERIEWEGWYWNIWFDVLLLLVFLLVISPMLYMLTPLSWNAIVSTVCLKLGIGFVLFLLTRFLIFPSFVEPQILVDCYFESIVRQLESR